MRRLAVLALVFCLGSAAVGQAGKPRQATLVQQKICAEQAKKTFHEDNPTRPEHMLTWEYTSHYDAAMNVCYIMTHFVQVKDSTFNLSYTVYDAFEGREYANFIQTSPKEKPWCEITPLGKDAITCNTSDEFQALVDKNFGIGR
jgi:hypothetical protein